MSQATLEVRNLQTHFFTRAGVAKAVEDVSFTVAPGQILGLVGESGSGKSVTGFSILGLVDPPGRVVGGQIRFNGKELIGLPEEQMRRIRGNRMAMVFQDPMMTLNPVLRIDTQMIEAILAHKQVGRKVARQQARDVLGQVGIPSPDERLQAYPHQFSGGMRQRVAIAIALLNKPDLIIADEPTTALDVTIQAQILQLMRDLQAEFEMSILLITHDLGVVAEMADQVAVMYMGRIVEQAEMTDLFTNPQHPYTQALLESIPGRGKQPKAELKVIAGSVPNPFEQITGCPFHPRCEEFSDGHCNQGDPPMLSQLRANQHVACFIREKGKIQ